MTSETTLETIQVCRHCGDRAPLDAHFCRGCSRILPLGRHTDYFSFFGLPRRIGVDGSDLELRFRALSRQFHPDYFYNATPAERRASLERSSYLNDAYRTLRHPIGRIDYLVTVEAGRLGGSGRAGGAVGPGVAGWPGGAGGPGGAGDGAVPAALLEEVFALNEELDEVRELRASGAPADEWKARLERASQPIEAKRALHERQLHELSTTWDELVAEGALDAKRRPVLEGLRQRLLERNYINNLLEGIERELESEIPNPESRKHV